VRSANLDTRGYKEVSLGQPVWSMPQCRFRTSSCNCADAEWWVAGEWSAPWTHAGECYTGQPYAACEGLSGPASLPEFGGALDGATPEDAPWSATAGTTTWCWNSERQMKCPGTLSAGYTPTWEERYTEYPTAAPTAAPTGAPTEYPDADRCTQTQCTSPDGRGGTDCWAGSLWESCTCSQGLLARLTGPSIVHTDDRRYYQYTCCPSDAIDTAGEICGDRDLAATAADDAALRAAAAAAAAP
jgi:hypothetical protein